MRPVVLKVLEDPIRKKCFRSVLILGIGAIVYLGFHSLIPPFIGAPAAIAVLFFAYWPLARMRCPHCGHFPFKTWLNVGPLPFLCFVPVERCRNCDEDIFLQHRKQG